MLVLRHAVLPSKCAVAECLERKVHGRRLCPKHYAAKQLEQRKKRKLTTHSENSRSEEEDVPPSLPTPEKNTQVCRTITAPQLQDMVFSLESENNMLNISDNYLLITPESIKPLGCTGFAEVGSQCSVCAMTEKTLWNTKHKLEVNPEVKDIITPNVKKYRCVI